MVKRPKGSGEADRERDPFLDAIGHRIKVARTRAGLTQKQLAELIGTAQGWVFLVEDGQQNCQIHSLRRIAEALGISLRGLLPDEPELAMDAGRADQVAELVQTLVADATRSLGNLHKLAILAEPRRDPSTDAEPRH